jgi:hypothetical protein
MDGDRVLASSGPTAQGVIIPNRCCACRSQEAESAGGIVATVRTGLPTARDCEPCSIRGRGRFLAVLSGVTPQAVRAIVRRTLDRSHRVVVITKPKG